MKKRIISLIMCFMLILPMFSFGVAATETRDIRDLADKGQDHIYTGEAWAATSPKANGTIASGEYAVSKDITLNNCPAGDFSDAKIHFSHDSKSIYIGLEVKEPKYDFAKSKYAFNLNFPVSGGFADAATYVNIPLNVTSSGSVNISSVSYLDRNGGLQTVSYGFDSSSIVSTKSIKHDTATKVTTVELILVYDGFSTKLSMDTFKEMMFSMELTTNSKTYNYRVELDAATQAAVAAAYPDRAVPALTWAPHIVHFEAAPDVASAYDFYTVDGASVKAIDDKKIGLRFETVFKKSYIDGLKAANPNSEIYVGTLITEKTNLRQLKNEFTKSALEGHRSKPAFTEVYADINAPLRSDDTTYTFAGSIRTALNGATAYAAIGFVNIDGNYTYSPTYTTRSAAGVGAAALRDLSSAASTAYPTEVAIRTNSVSSNNYSKIIDKAYSCYSDAQLLDYFRFNENTNQIVLSHFWDVQPKLEGTVRIVSSNVYFHNINWHHKNETEAQKKAVIKQNADFFKESQGDVLLLQEVSNGIWGTADYLVQKRLNPMLEEIGYKMVDAKVGAFPKGTNGDNSAGVNYTPIWYNPDVVTLEASEHVFYTSVRTNPDGRLSSSKGFTWALFTEKATGKQFIAASTHLTYHGDSTIANALRKDDAGELTKRLTEVSAQYNAPVIVGGDFNCGSKSEPYAIINAKFANVRSLANTILNGDYATMHSYPSDELPALGGSQIDHIFVSKDKFNVKLYQTMISYKSLVAADHIPTSIDFTIK